MSTGAWTIHIGYQKCGSTWLQTRVFPEIEGVRYHGKHGNTRASWFGDLVDLLRRPSMQRDLRPIRTRMIADQQSCNLLSAEAWVGTPQIAGRDAENVLAGLQALDLDMRVIVVIRNQETLLPSLYAQYVLEGGTMRPERFFADYRTSRRFSLAFADFLPLVRAYYAAFGADRVLVLPHEVMLEDPDAAARRIAQFAGGHWAPESPTAFRDSVRRRLTGDECRVMRLANMVFKSIEAPDNLLPPRYDADDGPPAAPRWLAARLALPSRRLCGDGERALQEAASAVCGRFAAGNAELQRLTGLDLARYGYRVTASAQASRSG